MESATWQLAREVHDTADPELLDFIGQLLALLGPLPPSATANTALSAAQKETRKSLVSSGGQALVALDEMLIQAMQQLAAFLVDEDAQTVALAQSTLRQVCEDLAVQNPKPY